MEKQTHEPKNRIADPEINECAYSHITFSKGTTESREKASSSNSGAVNIK